MEEHFKKIIFLLEFMDIDFYSIFTKKFFNIVIFVIKFILFLVVIIIFNF